jgi:signal transduction histidine kinase
MGSDSAGSEPVRRRFSVVALVMAIAVTDVLTPTGISVGILYAIPILLSARGQRTAEVLTVSSAALLLLAGATLWGAPPISPSAVWIPNRIFSALVVVSATAIALALQRSDNLRRSAERRSTQQAELNRVLLALVTHDVRSPLGSASHALEYVLGALEDGAELDRELLESVDTRIQRSLGTTEMILEIVRQDMTALEHVGTGAGGLAGEALLRELNAEVAAFRVEAEPAGKPITVRWAAPASIGAVNPFLARQALAVLLDNVLEHARPGPVTVEAAPEREHLVIRVTDAGTRDVLPQPSAAVSSPRAGARLGLELCRTLVMGLGGDVNVRPSPDGTLAELRLRMGRGTGTDVGGKRPETGVNGG